MTARADSVARLYPCEACGLLDELIALARTRITRSPTSAEQAQFGLDVSP